MSYRCKMPDASVAAGTMPRVIVIGAALAGWIALASSPAQAGLLGASNTVEAIFWNGAVDSLSGTTHHGTELQDSTQIGTSNSGPASLASSVTYPAANFDYANITVNDTTITIQNTTAGATCSNGTLPCSDSFWGFEFKFTGNIDITGATVGLSTPSDFQPVTLDFGQPGATYGSSTDLFVNAEGLTLAANDTLTIDLTFAGSNPGGTSVPEPASMLLLATGVLGLAAARRLRRV